MTALTRHLRWVRYLWQPSFRLVANPSYLATRLHGSDHNHHDDHHHGGDHHHNLYAQHLRRRGLVEISGPESMTFLQGLVSNDMNLFNVSDEPSSLYAGMLNAQGRLLYDLIVYNISKDTFWAECDSNATEDIIKILRRHRLRKKIDIEEMSEGMKIWSLFRDLSHPDMDEPDFIDQKFNLVFASDPRLKAFGWRLILPEHTRMENTVRNAFEVVNDDDLYSSHRYKIGIAEGVDELLPGKSFPLESNFNFLNGVSFTKGCYVGQELTARTFNTGVTRKRLMPVEFDSETCSVGAKIRANGKDVGTVRAVQGRYGLALVRIGNLSSRRVTVVDADVESGASLNVPSWWPLADPEFKKVGFGLN